MLVRVICKTTVVRVFFLSFASKMRASLSVTFCRDGLKLDLFRTIFLISLTYSEATSVYLISDTESLNGYWEKLLFQCRKNFRNPVYK